MGRSGCGKGTQAAKLQEYIHSKFGMEREIFYLETGERFREFIKAGGYSGNLAAEINNVGGLQPAFLAVWNWAHLFVEKMTGEEHLIADGVPRTYQEALVFDSAMTFYKRVKPFVIYIDVSRDWSRERLLGRGRSDDKAGEQIERRLNWFDTDVLPAIDFFRDHPQYHFVHLDGEQTIEKVSADMIAEIEKGE
jgi:adenylate kinase family enzyme